MAITTMWKIRPSEFLLVCITNRPDKDGKPANNNYVVDVATGDIRESKFTLGKLQDLHLDQHMIGDFCMFRTFDFENGAALETPVFYIENESETVVDEHTWKCSYLHKYELVGKNTIVEGMYENADVKEVTMLVREFSKETWKWFPRMEIYTHFLEETFEKIDFDLLFSISKIV